MEHHTLSVSVLHCLSSKCRPPTHTHTHAHTIHTQTITAAPLLSPLAHFCCLYISLMAPLCFEPMAAQGGHIPYNFKGCRIFSGHELISAPLKCRSPEYVWDLTFMQQAADDVRTVGGQKTNNRWLVLSHRQWTLTNRMGKRCDARKAHARPKGACKDWFGING